MLCKFSFVYYLRPHEHSTKVLFWARSLLEKILFFKIYSWFHLFMMLQVQLQTMQTFLSSASLSSLSNGRGAPRLTLFPDHSGGVELDRCSRSVFRPRWGSGNSQEWRAAKPAGTQSHTVSISVCMRCSNRATVLPCLLFWMYILCQFSSN